MPKRTDIRTILILGSGPIVIGQGCEFDYSGTQACKALKTEGYRIVLVNSNPATIMTDPAFSDRTYIEPITPASVRKVIEKEKERGEPIDAILPTLGGQTALNCACKLFDDGTLKEFGIEMIGANRQVIHRAEDRQIFKDICEAIGLKLPKAKTVTTLADGEAFLAEIGLPAIIRPAFTLGGSGGGIAYNAEEFRDIVTRGLAASMIGQVQIDQSVIGWKEYELEVVRDKKDNCIIVCGVENIDPMGIHTGDSITVAPILTLTDKEYQAMRDAAFAIMRAVGVETGGSNVQFAVNPNPKPDADGKKHFEMVVVEMNPRVSRSSALASKATGFPIAKIAAKLAVGYTLDELRNDITGTTSACFEPAIDYIVVKMPRWTFEKFPEADETLTTQMKSVGEAMAIGRTFKEAFQKVIRSMEVKRFGLGLDRNDKWLAAMRAVEHGQLVLDVMGTSPGRVADGSRSTALPGGLAQPALDRPTDVRSPEGKPGGSPVLPSPTGLRTADGDAIEWPIPLDKLTRKLAVPSQGRPYYIRYALKMGWSIERIHGLTNIDPFFLDQIAQLVEFEDVLCSYRSLDDVPREVLFQAKQHGYSDAQLANLYLGTISADTILKVREHRKRIGIEPVYKLVDTCAAEFEAATPYYYSTYEGGLGQSDDEIRVSDRKKVIIIGGGPNRIGQGIEFDYCCVHAAMAARDLDFESVMINSNPETVSTDYDTSDLLFFEPLTLEDTLNVIERLNGQVLSSVFDPIGTAESKSMLEGIGSKSGIDLTALEWSVPPSVLETLRQEADRLRLGRSAIVSMALSPSPTDKVCSVFYVLTADERMFEFGFNAKKPPRLLQHREVGPEHHDQILSRSDANWVSSARKFLSTPALVHGVIVQFGGQTPLNLAHGLQAAGAPIIGTSVDSIDLAEDRDRFDALLTKLNLARPASGIARSLDEAIRIAGDIGYPVLVRPSFVLGGRGMEICPDEKSLRHFMTSALKISEREGAPVLIDQFLDAATEVDVDVVADFVPSVPPTSALTSRCAPGEEHRLSKATVGGTGTGRAIICGVMEHIEQAGIHSGDSACSVPPWSLRGPMIERIKDLCRRLAAELKVCGLMNVQLALKDDRIYILEVNPRASRTAPFVGKARHTAWPMIAAKVAMGKTLDELGVREMPDTIGPGSPIAFKEPVFPFGKFPGVDVVLGPEMRSTGEVMGIDASMPLAYAKAKMAAGVDLPTSGGVFISVREADRPLMVDVARSLLAMGFKVYCTQGTGEYLNAYSLRTWILQKIAAGARPNVIDLMSNEEIGLIINTPTRTGWQTDEGKIRASAVRLGVPMITTATAATVAVRAIEALRAGDWGVAALQDYARSNSPVPTPVIAAGRRRVLAD